MKVILLERIPNLGSLGDVVTVKNGYGRNYLLPSKLAMRVNEANLAEFAARREEYERKQNDDLASAQFRKSKIDGVVFTITAKAGVDGKLFGSVTAMDIANGIKTVDTEIKRSEIALPHGPLKTIGDFEVDVRLHHDVNALVKVSVVSEA